MNPNEKKEINLLGQFCPFPVMNIIREVDRMRGGEVVRFNVDDPLAVKSIPEELEDYSDISISITKNDKGWDIVISKNAGNPV